VDRKTNTAKRAREAANAEAAAEAQKAFAKTLRRIAEGVADGSITHLAGLSQAVQLDLLNKSLRMAIGDYARSQTNLSYRDREELEARLTYGEATPDELNRLVLKAELPTPKATPRDLEILAGALADLGKAGVKGVTRLSQRLNALRNGRTDDTYDKAV